MIVVDFLPDIFSQSEPVYSDVDVSIRGELTAVVSDHYAHLELKVIDVRKSGEIEINSSNFLVKTDKGTYLLKLFQQLAVDVAGIEQRELLEKQYALMDWLHGQEVPSPWAIEASTHKYVCDIDSKRSAVLMSFVPGSYFSGAQESVHTVGDAVGRMHAVLKSIPEDLQLTGEIPSVTLEEKAIFTAMVENRHTEQGILSAEHQALLAKNKYFLSTIWDEVLDHEQTYFQSPRGLQHIDLHPHNILMNGSQVAAFLDFDSLKLGPLKSMLGFSAFKLLRQVVCASGNSLQVVEQRELVNIYCDAIFVHLPELRSDLKSISLFAYAEVCRRISSIFKLNIVDNNPQWNHVLEIQIAGLKEIESLFGPLSC
jgi:aminoglycoside phosphotransferase (APT) family kinase protein